MEDAEALSEDRAAARSALELSAVADARSTAVAPVAAAAEHVVLLHGILRTPRQMRPLQRSLETAGYVVHNIGYPSTKLDLAALVEHVHVSLSKPAVAAGLASAPRVHFVGYSLGGLVARAYLKRYRPLRLGRVVLLATPNHGSEVADVLKPLLPYHWIAGPVGQELGTDRSAIEALFSPVDYEVGVLAGDISLDPLGSLVLPRPHDGKVSVESTRLPGMVDHRVLHASHTFFPANDRVIEETVYFLREGRFAPAA